MNAKQWMGTGMATVMMGTMLVGCGSNQGQGGAGSNSPQELNLALGDDVPTMDLSMATDAYSFDLLNATMEGLTRLDKDGKAQPGIATNWDVSKDGLTYTFHLRKDAKWSNGDPLTAKDFEYSWKRTLDPKTASQYSFMMMWLKGGSDYFNGKGSVDNVGVKATDDYTLQVTLANPTPFFLNQTAFPMFFPQDQKFVESKGKNYGSSPDTVLSDGPFKLTSWQQGASLTIQKNDTYWDAKSVKLSKVNFQIVKDSATELNLYQSGQLDRASLVKDSVDQYKNNAQEYSVVPELTNGYVEFNEKVKGLDNVKVRNGLTWAIDRDMYADVVYHNGTVGATGYVPNGTSDSAGGDFRKDAGVTLDKHTAADAKTEFEQGLKEAGLTASTFNMTLLVDDSDVSKKAAEFLQEQWRSKLGINVNVQSVPFKLRLQRTQKFDYQMAIGLWGADYNDPMTFMDMWTTGGQFNEVGYSNKDYDALVNQAKTTADVKQRAQLLVQAEKVMMKDMPVGPIFFRGRAYATKPYVKNFEAFPYGVDFDLKNTYIEGK